MGGTVYAIAGGKGGVGKTTTVINLGVVLAQSGQDVVVVDADLAMANLGQQLGIDHEPTIQQVLAGEAALRDAVVEGPAGLAVVPGGRTLDGFAAADPAELHDVFDLLRVAYDVILVDTGPGVQRDSFLVYRAADGVVVPTTDRELAVADANRTAAMAVDADCPPVGAVVTRATDAEAVAENLTTAVLSVVPEHRTGGPVTASQPDSDAAAAYRELAASLPAVDRHTVIPEEPVPDEGADAEDTADADAEDADETSAGVGTEDSSTDTDADEPVDPDTVAETDAAGSAATEDGRRQVERADDVAVAMVAAAEGYETSGADASSTVADVATDDGTTDDVAAAEEQDGETVADVDAEETVSH